MKQLAILTTSIIDEQCVVASQNSLHKFLISKNPDVHFTQIVHVDNHKRSLGRYSGSLDSIINIYKNQCDAKNYTCNLIIGNPRNGIIKAAYNLFESFIETNIENCLIFEDDTTLERDVNISNLLNIFSDDSILHLSFAVETTATSAYSTEMPFINEDKDNSYSEKEYIFFKRKYKEKPSFTWNGTFLNQNLIRLILKNYNKNITNESGYPEDQIAKILYKSNPELFIKTIFYNAPLHDEQVKEGWNLKISPSQHVIFDKIRYSGGRSRALY